MAALHTFVIKNFSGGKVEIRTENIGLYATPRLHLYAIQLNRLKVHLELSREEAQQLLKGVTTFLKDIESNSLPD